MSSEHKRPMVAFLVVLMLGVVVLAGAARTDAVRGFLEDTVGHVSVAGRHLAPQPHGVTREPQRTSRTAVRTPATGAPVVLTRSQHSTEDRTGHPNARWTARGPGRRHDQFADDRRVPPAHARAWAAPPAHAQAHGLHKSPGPARAKSHRDARTDREHTRTPHPGKAHGKGHAKARGKGHAKAHGKGHAKARGHRRH